VCELQGTVCNCKKLTSYIEGKEGTRLRRDVKKRSVTSHQGQPLQLVVAGLVALMGEFMQSTRPDFQLQVPFTVAFTDHLDPPEWAPKPDTRVSPTHLLLPVVTNT
jgi:hypothetical protein